jgi:hypothetical protein
VHTQQVAVVVEEQAALVVLRQAPLPAAGCRLRQNRAAAEAVARVVVRALDPVVERPQRAVGHVLRLTALLAERVVDRLPQVGHAVAVGVAMPDEVRRFGDQRAVAERHHRARHHQRIDEHRRPVEDAVAVGVLEPRDPAGRLVFAAAFHVVHVAAHLADVEPRLCVEAGGDRRFDHRLARHELGFEPGRQAQRLLRLGGGEWWWWRQPEADLGACRGHDRRCGPSVSGPAVRWTSAGLDVVSGTGCC